MPALPSGVNHEEQESSHESLPGLWFVKVPLMGLGERKHKATAGSSDGNCWKAHGNLCDCVSRQPKCFRERLAGIQAWCLDFYLVCKLFVLCQG